MGLVLCAAGLFGCGETASAPEADDDSGKVNHRTAELTPGGWNHSATLYNPSRNKGGASFGGVLALDGDRVAVGAREFDTDIDRDGQVESDVGAVFTYERVDGIWRSRTRIDLPNPTAGASGQRFGTTVAMKGDLLAISAPGLRKDVDGDGSNEIVGAAFLFRRSDGKWKKQKRFLAPQRESFFGFDLALREDTLFVGAVTHEEEIDGVPTEVGTVHVYERRQGTWSRTGELRPDETKRRQQFGNSIDLDGRTVVVGAAGDRQDLDDDSAPEPEVGAVFVYERDGGNWSRIDAWTGESPAANFGRQVALGEDRALVSAPDESLDRDGDGDSEGTKGVVYVYEQRENEWQRTDELSGPRGAGLGSNDVALAGDRAFATIGWRQGGLDYGGAFAYEHTGGDWNSPQTVEHPDADTGTDFGQSLAARDNTLLVGAPSQSYDFDENGTIEKDEKLAGAVFVFTPDRDGDDVPDEADNCPATRNPGQADSDGDGTGDACDRCPEDPDKSAPGACGCGTADDDTDGDGTPDCNDACPSNGNKTVAGACGCGAPETDSDGDGLPDCIDSCPNQAAPTGPDAGTAADGCPPESDGCSTVDGRPRPWLVALWLVGLAGLVLRSRRRN